MQTLTDIGTLIISTPETCGDRLTAGTRITVQRIVVWYKMGISAASANNLSSPDEQQLIWATQQRYLYL